MKKTLMILALIIMLVSAAMTPAITIRESVGAQVGVTYTVSTLGNDTNFCTPTSPCRTIKHGIAIASNGGTVSVLAGDYTNEGRLSMGKPITLVCADQHKCRIQSITITSGSTIDGFYSINNPFNDGAIVGSGSAYKILNNKVEGSCMVGIKLNGSNGLAKSNEVFRSKQCSGSTGPDADGFRFFGSGHILRDNFIHDIRFADSSGSPHIDCFQTWSGASNILMEGNVCDNYDAKVGENNGTQGANLEDCDGCNFKNNFFHVYGKGVLWESSSINGSATNNIFVSGPKITGSTSGQYCLFGDTKATGNICYLYSSGNVLVAGATGTGNVTTNPQMSGYCSLAFPDKGITCTGAATVTPAPSPTITPTKAPTATKTATGSPTASRTANPPTLTRTASPSVTASRTATVLSPSTTPTPSKTATKAPTATYTQTPVPSSPTQSAVPGTITPTRTPIVVTVTPSPTPAPSCPWRGWSHFWEWWACVRRR